MENKLIILAEDQKDQTIILASALSSSGYKIVTTKNGLEALELLRQGHLPHVLITDVRMPGLSGFGLMKEIKKMGLSIPTIVISGRREDADLEQAFILGALGYLKKPIVLNELIDKVKRASDGARH